MTDGEISKIKDIEWMWGEGLGSDNYVNVATEMKTWRSFPCNMQLFCWWCDEEKLNHPLELFEIYFNLHQYDLVYKI